MRPRASLVPVTLLALSLVLLSCGRRDAPSDARDTAALPASAPPAEIGRIVTDSFVLVVHDVERFTPPETAIWRAAPGHEYLALDVALHNPTADSIALGWSTIAPAVVDAGGARHPFLPALVAAFEMESPRGARFDSTAFERLIGGRLAAGDSVRAWAWAFEVPAGEPLELEVFAQDRTRHRIAIAR
ncbi:MAG TPA: hypothetical protein VFZ11_08555 [Gemmatimonadaceae bacterium]